MGWENAPSAAEQRPRSEDVSTAAKEDPMENELKNNTCIR
jgi:hypothetical protein